MVSAIDIRTSGAVALIDEAKKLFPAVDSEYRNIVPPEAVRDPICEGAGEFPVSGSARKLHLQRADRVLAPTQYVRFSDQKRLFDAELAHQVDFLAIVEIRMLRKQRQRRTDALTSAADRQRYKSPHSVIDEMLEDLVVIKARRQSLSRCLEVIPPSFLAKQELTGVRIDREPSRCPCPLGLRMHYQSVVVAHVVRVDAEGSEIVRHDPLDRPHNATDQALRLALGDAEQLLQVGLGKFFGDRHNR